MYKYFTHIYEIFYREIILKYMWLYIGIVAENVSFWAPARPHFQIPLQVDIGTSMALPYMQRITG